MTNLGFCRLRLDASCSTGTIDAYEWQLDTGGVLNGPVSATGQVVFHDYSLYPFCLLDVVSNALTVRGPGGQNTVTQTYRFLFERGEEPRLEARLLTTLSIDESAAGGRISVNGTSAPVPASSAPVVLTFSGREGENELEARVVRAFEGAGSWTFDFSGTRHFVPGSLRVEQGDVIAMTGTQVALRLSGSNAAPIRLRFALAAERP